MSEIRKGHWKRATGLTESVYDPTTDYAAYAHYCSNCWQRSYFPLKIPDRYCRHCGARMVKE